MTIISGGATSRSQIVLRRNVFGEPWERTYDSSLPCVLAFGIVPFPMYSAHLVSRGIAHELMIDEWCGRRSTIYPCDMIQHYSRAPTERRRKLPAVCEMSRLKLFKMSRFAKNTIVLITFANLFRHLVVCC
eukprot:scaffold272226_cov42-Prasinocladus_malaysianus.AAC.1